MKTILLIEDDDFIRENTAELLELAGFAVLTAENGKVGVQQALARKPDLVVCDIMMPVLDGYGVLQIFNQNAQLAVFGRVHREAGHFEQLGGVLADGHVVFN